MSKLADVVKKVQKLLNVANRSDKPGEIAAAQLLAQQLITKYQIEEAQLHGNSMNGDITSVHIATRNPYAIDKATLLNSIALPNFCKVLRGDEYCIIYGYASDIELCVALYDVLSMHMISEMTVKLKKLKESSTEKIRTKEWVRGFFGGYAINIGERIKQAKKDTIKEVDSNGTSLALVLRNKQHVIEDYWQQLVRNTGSKRKITSISGYKAGKESAAAADLNKNKIE